jgi:cysteine desulfurase
VVDDSVIYADYAAATPLDRQVLEAMMPYLTDRFANPSALYGLGRQQRQDLEAARRRIAAVLGAKPAEIIYTGGSTEGAWLAVEVVLSQLEHSAVLAAAHRAAPERVREVKVPPSGVINAQELAGAITDQTVLVCLQYANNELGTLQPVTAVVKQVAAIRTDREARSVERPLYLYCDAAQAGLLSLQVSRLGVDLLSMGGSKLYGPAGSGFLYLKAGTKLQSLRPGGGQEQGLRGGTESVAAAVGLATALELVQADRAEESRRLAKLRDQLWESLQKLEGVRQNGDSAHRLPSFLNLSVEGVEGEALVAHLDAVGVAAATGSACMAANQEPSHVLLAIGLSRIQAESSLRLTLGRQTTDSQINRMAELIISTIIKLRKLPN